MPRPDRQTGFILTADRLKGVTRTTLLHDGSRPENSAEHSWHLALMALTLAEYAPAGTDLNRVIHLLLVHDLVEIYAGDTHFDQSAERAEAQRAKEMDAAHRLFSLLPADQEAQFHDLWREFEERQTPEARFAKALDALQPMLLTWGPDGQGSAAHPELTRQRVLRLKHGALSAFPELWAYAQEWLTNAVGRGILADDQIGASIIPARS